MRAIRSLLEILTPGVDKLSTELVTLSTGTFCASFSTRFATADF